MNVGEGPSWGTDGMMERGLGNDSPEATGRLPYERHRPAFSILIRAGA